MKFGDGVIIQGTGPNSTIIEGNLSTAVLQSRKTTDRYNSVQIRDLQIQGGSIGIDFTNINMSVIRDVVIKTVGTGILISHDAYHNDLFSPIIMGAGVGINIMKGANENRIFGGRIQNTRYGIRLDVSNPQIYGTSWIKT